MEIFLRSSDPIIDSRRRSHSGVWVQRPVRWLDHLAIVPGRNRFVVERRRHHLRELCMVVLLLIRLLLRMVMGRVAEVRHIVRRVGGIDKVWLVRVLRLGVGYLTGLEVLRRRIVLLLDLMVSRSILRFHFVRLKPDDDALVHPHPVDVYLLGALGSTRRCRRRKPTGGVLERVAGRMRA